MRFLVVRDGKLRFRFRFRADAFVVIGLAHVTRATP
jgi:hypothetical protein